MLVGLGKAAAKYMLIFGIISTIIITFLVSYGLKPPDPLTVVPISGQKIQEYVAKVNQTNFNNPVEIATSGGVASVTLAQILLALAVGIPLLLNKLAALTGIPAIIFGATIVGGILQLAIYFYIFHLILEWIKGTGE